MRQKSRFCQLHPRRTHLDKVSEPLQHPRGALTTTSLFILFAISVFFELKVESGVRGGRVVFREMV
jgi:hypothetical protein